MTYKEHITNQCTEYSKDPLARFIGYNTAFGSRMYGTLDNVPVDRCIETPVCENLMVGLAMGMAIEGYKPVICFERHDFMLIALDALVNHMDKMPWLSGDRFKFPIVVRAIVGSKTPLDPGPLHNQDYTEILELALKYTDIFLADGWDMVGKTNSGAVVIIEHKDLYNTEFPTTCCNDTCSCS